MASLFQTVNAPVRKRRVFFSFHYQNDIWRVNQVRQSWRYNHEYTRETEGFFDGSIWESSRRTGPDSLTEGSFAEVFVCSCCRRRWQLSTAPTARTLPPIRLPAEGAALARARRTFAGQLRLVP